jgi:hypothetical protein
LHVAFVSPYITKQKISFPSNTWSFNKRKQDFVFGTYRTGSTVETRNDCAVIFDQLAIGSSVFSRTGTGVRTLARVKTGAAVLAGFVIGAVVKILIAKQTTPTFIAITLPRLLARSMKATWIADALVTQLSLPSQFAPNETNKKEKNKMIR